MSLTADEIIKVMERAKELGIKTISTDGLSLEITPPAPEPAPPVPDLKADEIVRPLSVLDDLTDEEILYYATPYYDVLQKRKEAHRQKLEEESKEKTG